MARFSSEQFRECVKKHLADGRRRSAPFIELTSGDVHREVGGYPGTGHAMPSCCNAMRNLMGPRDQIVAEPSKGNGASLRIRYYL